MDFFANANHKVKMYYKRVDVQYKDVLIFTI